MKMKITNKEELILNFIEQFRNFGPGVEECFTQGMCWHFASILKQRFGHGCYIMYDPIMNHFATNIDGRIYDITGDITHDPKYSFVHWAKYALDDTSHTERIRRDCILKVPADTLICHICGECFWDEIGNDICGLDNRPVDLDTVCPKGKTREDN